MDSNQVTKAAATRLAGSSSYAQLPNNCNDLAMAIGPIARALLGEPIEEIQVSQELRFGTDGSLSVYVEKGIWRDFATNEGGCVLSLVRREIPDLKDDVEAAAWMRDNGYLPKPARSKPAAKKIVAIYDYTAVNGTLLFQVLRYPPKDFRQRRPDGKGGWSWTMAGVERVLYRLPKVIAAVAAGSVVYIAEGEKGVHALETLGLDATCSPGGIGKWSEAYNSPFAGADVVILPDNDDPGRIHATDVARHLAGIAARVRILALSGLPLIGGGVADWTEAEGTAAVLEELVRNTPQEEVSPALDHKAAVNAAPDKRQPASCAGSNHQRPVIYVVAGELPLTATEGENVLVRGGAEIYQRGFHLVRPVTQEMPASHGRTTRSASLMEMNITSLVDALGAAAIWKKYDRRSCKWERINPPRDVADTILSRVGKWTFPLVVGTITTPTIRRDGSILHVPGYDKETRLFLVRDKSICLSPLVEKPTKLTASLALRLLLRLLQEFPFANEVSKAVSLSALITPIVRGALTVAPMHGATATTAGSGKSFLMDVMSTIASGRPCPVISAGPDAVETEKRLNGQLLFGLPLICLDNVNGELGGDLLCQAIERPLVQVRRLGKSDIAEIESRSTIFATGNGLRVHGDMTRRTLLCNLNAQMERPELREFRADPVATVMENRSRYISACIIIVRAYILADKPGKLPPIASFSEWSNLVRSALVWLGCADPADSMEVARKDDPELEKLREVISAMRESSILDGGSTVKELIAMAASNAPAGDGNENGMMKYSQPDLHDAFLKIAGVRGVIENTRLGTWFRKSKGRIVDGYQITQGADARGGAARWMVQRLAP